jgi:hypothetical protein
MAVQSDGAALSEKEAKLAQKLGQLQHFIAIFPSNAWADCHLLGQPDTFFALVQATLAASSSARRRMAETKAKVSHRVVSAVLGISTPPCLFYMENHY